MSRKLKINAEHIIPANVVTLTYTRKYLQLKTGRRFARDTIIRMCLDGRLRYYVVENRFYIDAKHLETAEIDALK